MASWARPAKADAGGISTIWPNAGKRDHAHTATTALTLRPLPATPLLHFYAATATDAPQLGIMPALLALQPDVTSEPAFMHPSSCTYRPRASSTLPQSSVELLRVSGGCAGGTRLHAAVATAGRW
jgi:hypothetical protein